ncbi:MAG: hypothetical protein HS103_01410 [Anaerolineales bacterium]|nr:hypothetical protein [Anaerolineales bacterium]
MAKTPVTSPFKAMEEEAYHAFREWPIFLVLRQKELETHLSPAGASSNAPGAAKTGQRPETELTKGKKT